MRSAHLSNRIREVLLDGKWIANTHFAEATEGIDLAVATKRIGDHNSIATLTFHLNYYLAGILRVMEGGPLDIHDRYSFDMPPLRGEADWQQLRRELLSNAAAMVKHVASMSDAQLREGFVKPEYGTWERNIEGLVEHSYYHLGQISLLRKLMVSEK